MSEQSNEVKMRIPGCTIDFYQKVVGKRGYSIPDPNDKDPKHEKRLPLGLTGMIIKTNPDLSSAEATQDINAWTDQEKLNLDESISLQFYNQQGDERKLDLRKKFEIGFRLTWSIKAAGSLLVREDRGDRKEAYHRYKKVLQLAELIGSTVADKEAVRKNPTFLNTDVIVFQEITDAGELKWKNIPDSSKAQAMLGLAEMLLEDIGRGRTDKEISQLYGYADKDVALDEAIKYITGEAGARALLLSESADKRDYYSIGRTYIVEAKLRVLRRKGDIITGEDSNTEVTRLLNEWLSGYTLISQVDGRTIAEYIAANENIKKFKKPGTQEDEAVPLAKLGILYLHKMAKLELLKLAIETDDAKTALDASESCKNIEDSLTEDALKAAIPELGTLRTKNAKKELNKTGDYLRFDAIISRADLLTLYGNITGGEVGDRKLNEARNIYLSIDDLEKGGVCPYQDIQARAVVSRMSLERMLERFTYENVRKNLEAYFDPIIKAGDVDVTAPFFEGSFLFYRMEYSKATLLLERNEFADSYPARLEGLNGSIVFGGGASQSTIVKDATMARCLALDILWNIDSVKASNPKGKIDLKNRARLLEIQAEIRLLKYVADESKTAKIEDIRRKIESLAADLLTAEDRKKGLDLHASLMANTSERKYNNMDYPFYVDLFTEWASLLEQSALVGTKHQRESENPDNAEIRRQFEPVENMYRDLSALCRHPQSNSTYDHYVRPVAIALRELSNAAARDINTVARVANWAGVLTRLGDSITAMEGYKFGTGADDTAVKDIPRLSVIKEDDLEKVKVVIDGREVKILKEVAMSVYYTMLSMKLDLMARKVFFVNRQDIPAADKKTRISALYAEAKTVADEAAPKLIDPHYLVSNMMAMSMVVMKYQDLRKGAADTVYSYFNKYVYRYEGRNVMFTFEMCEALAICASRNRDKNIAMDIMRSLDSIIPQRELELAAATEEAAQKDIRSLLADAYYWKANLKAWFYEESGTDADKVYLEGVSGDYAKAIGYYNEYTTGVQRQSGFIPARVNKALADYRLAVLNLKIALKNQGSDAVTNLLNGYDVVIDGKEKVHYPGYIEIARELNGVAGINLTGITIERVRFMTDEDVSRKKAEFACAQVDALKGLIQMTFSLRNLVEKGKVRVTGLNDGVTVYDAGGTSTSKTYIEMRAEVGDVINKGQMVLINTNRAAQADNDNNMVYAGSNAGKVNIVSDNVGILMTLAQANTVLQAMGQNDVADKNGLFGIGNGLFVRARGLSDAISGITSDEKKDYKVDVLSLSKSYVGEIAVLSTIIPYIRIPGGTDIGDRAIGEELNKATGELNRLGAGDEAAIWTANIIGWEAMSSENLARLQKASGDYGGVNAESRDAETFRNWADVLVMICRRTKAEADKSRAIKKLNETSDVDKSTIGASALSTLANLQIGYEDFKGAKDSAVKALSYLTRRACPEGQDASTFYLRVVSGDSGLKKERTVLEALSYLVIADAWIYTKLDAPQRVGELNEIDGIAYHINAGRVTRGKTYCEIMKKIGDALELAKEFKDDRRMKLIVSDESSVGFRYARNEIKKSYRGAERRYYSDDD